MVQPCWRNFWIRAAMRREPGGRVLNCATSQPPSRLRYDKSSLAMFCCQPGHTGMSKLSESWLPSPINRNNLRGSPARVQGSIENGAKPTSFEFGAKKARTKSSRPLPKACHHAESHSHVEKVVASG